MKNKKRPRSAIKTTTGSNNRSRIATDPLLMILTAFGALCLALDVAFAVYAGISVFAAEHGSGEALRWLDFLTEPPSIDDPEPPTFRWRGISEDYPVPGYFHRSPEWLVLKAVTGERLRSDYPMLSNASGGFENDVFAVFPEDIVVDGSSGVTEWSPCLVFKPTGVRISWDRDPDREADMSQDISWDDLARVLRLCIASACDSIREVDA